MLSLEWNMWAEAWVLDQRAGVPTALADQRNRDKAAANYKSLAVNPESAGSEGSWQLWPWAATQAGHHARSLLLTKAGSSKHSEDQGKWS